MAPPTGSLTLSLLLLQHQKKAVKPIIMEMAKKNEANMPHHSNQIMYKSKRMNFFLVGLLTRLSEFFEIEHVYVFPFLFIVSPDYELPQNTKSIG